MSDFVVLIIFHKIVKYFIYKDCHSSIKVAGLIFATRFRDVCLFV